MLFIIQFYCNDYYYNCCLMTSHVTSCDCCPMTSHLISCEPQHGVSCESYGIIIHVMFNAAIPRDRLEPFHMEPCHLGTDRACVSMGPVPFISETVQATCASQAH